MKKSLVILSIICSSTLFAQELPLSSVTLNRYFVNRADNIDLSTFQGSIFYNDSFSQGIIKDELNDTQLRTYLRYDTLNDYFQMSTTGNKELSTYLKRETPIVIFYENHKFKLENFLNKSKDLESGYLQELLKIGDLTIYARYIKIIKKPSNQPNSYGLPKEGEINDQFYFVVKTSESSSYQDIDRKNIQDFFPKELKAKVQNIVKSKKLKFKDPLDIEQLALNL